MMMNVNASMISMMSRMMSEVVSDAVNKCAEKYGFSGEEALRDLNVTVNVKKVEGKKVEKKEKKARARFPLPFSGEYSDICCQALRQNNGLYTQCQDARKGDGSYCKSCEKLADKSEAGIPEYGTIAQRMAVGPFEYTDPKGRKPTPYTKVMNKYKLTQEQVIEEAVKFGITINEEHFVAAVETKRGRPAQPKEAKEPKGAKGRPKKTKKVIQIDGDDEDLFASLVASASESDEVEIDAEIEAEKAAKKLALEQEKAAKKLALEQEKEAKKLALEQEKAAKKLALEQEKAEKKLALEAEKAAKLAAKEAEKLAKEAEKLAKEQEKAAKKTTKKVEEPEEEETFKKCGDKVDGKSKYIRSEQSGIVYDLDIYTKTEDLVPVGKWDAENKQIKFSKIEIESDEELEEDEVDE